MIRFVISNKKFLIPDLYSSFKGKEFFVKSSKNELKKFSERSLIMNTKSHLIKIT